MYLCIKPPPLIQPSLWLKHLRVGRPSSGFVVCRGAPEETEQEEDLGLSWDGVGEDGRWDES